MITTVGGFLLLPLQLITKAGKWKSLRTCQLRSMPKHLLTRTKVTDFGGYTLVSYYNFHIRWDSMVGTREETAAVSGA